MSRYILIVMLSTMLLVMITSSITTIKAGHVGIVQIFGKVSDKYLVSGMHLKNPFANIKKISIREKKIEVKLETYTKDIQIANLAVAFNYSINSHKAPELFKNIGDDFENILIMPIINDAIKTIVGKWDATAIIEKRNEAVIEMVSLINSRIGEGPINFINLAIQNIDYSEVFEKSIEEKQIATQKAIKAQNETIRIREEAIQLMISAEAEAEAIKIKAQALASNQSLVQWEAIQKWDGKLPQTMTGNSALPFIGIK